MNQFIQELRNLSSTSSASSNSSFDSGFSASFAGDSSAGSGRATTTSSSSINNTSTPQQNIIWGNKSLWGGTPQSPSPAVDSSSSPSSAAEPSNPNHNNNSMYVSKNSHPPPSNSSLWTAPINASSQVHHSPNFSPGIWENSGTKAAAELSASTAAASSLGSLWMIPETSRSVWGDSPKPNSQLLRPTEIGSSGSGSSNGVGSSKLSTLWAPNAAANAQPPQQPSSSLVASGNVLKSLRLAGTMGAGGGSSSSFGLGGLTNTPAVDTSANVAAATAATAVSSLQLFSDEFLSYLNINN